MATTAYDVMVRIEADIANLTRNLSSAGSTIGNLGRQAQNSGGIIQNALSFAGGLGITRAIEGIGSKFLEAGRMGWDFNSQMQQNLAAFKTMLGGSDIEAKKMIDTLTKMASITPFETTDLTKAATTLMGFGIEASKVKGTLQMLGDVSQGNKEKFDSLTLAFAQIQSAGKLTGQDLLQLVGAGFNPLKIMSEQTGKSMAILKDEMSKGSISAKMVEDAFVSATSKGGLFFGAMDAQSKTFSGQISTLRDNISLTFGQVMKPAFDMISNNALPAVINKLSIFQQSFQQSGSVITAFTSILGISNANITILNNSIKQIYELVIPPLVAAFTNISTTIMPALHSIFNTFTTIIIPNFNAGIMGFVQNVYPVITQALDFITKNIVPPLTKVFQFIYTEVLPRFSNMFKTVMPLVGKMILDLWTAAKPVLNLLVKAFEASWPAIKFTVMTAINIIEPAVLGLMKVLGGITTFIKGVFTLDWKTAWEGIKNIFSGTFGALNGIANGVANGVIDIINKMIRSLNALNFSIPDWIPGLGGRSFSLNIPQLPRYASGTNFAQGGLSLVGENGPEVVNLPRGSKVTPNGSIIDYNLLAQEIVSAFKQSPLQISINQDVNIDGQKAAKVMWPRLAEEKVRLGVASL